MGIYDREYYRREGPSFLGSFASRGRVCWWLIGINVAAFVIQLVTAQRVEAEGFIADVRWGPFVDWFILDSSAVLHGQVWRLLTYAFLHDPASIWHILFNMLFLWWFGKDMEDIYGSKEFLAFYLCSAVLGGVAFVLTNFRGGLCLGASGAVTAILVLYALHYPTHVIYIFLLVPVPIWLFVVFQVAQDTFIFFSQMKTGVAVVVHLAGAAFAFAYYKLHWRVLHIVPDLSALRRSLSRPRLRVYREEAPPPRVPTPVVAANGGDVDEHLEAKLDAVLEKVARHGRGSLSESEQQILVRASEVYKKRRQ